MRTVPLDVDQRFCEVAVHEGGEVRRLGRIETVDLRRFAESLGRDDHVVLESSSVSWAVTECMAGHAGRVTISNPMQTKAIASAKDNTATVNAKLLVRLGAANFLPEMWIPDEPTRALRRRPAHRSSLVGRRTGCATRFTPCSRVNLVELQSGTPLARVHRTRELDSEATGPSRPGPNRIRSISPGNTLIAACVERAWTSIPTSVTVPSMAGPPRSSGVSRSPLSGQPNPREERPAIHPGSQPGTGRPTP
jgi:hypothetical protein